MSHPKDPNPLIDPDPALAIRVAQGLEHQRAGRWVDARRCFEAALAQQPDHPVTLYSLAAVEANSGHPERALDLINRLIRERPGFAPAFVARATIHQQIGDLQRAIADLDLALRLEPGSAQAQRDRDRLRELTPATAPQPDESPADLACRQAIAAQQEGRIRQARELFEEAIAREPHHFAALYSLAVIANQQGLDDEALDLMGRAVSASPDNELGHFALGTLFQSRGLAEGALAAFDRALSLRPGYVEAINNKATLLHGLGRQKEALLAVESGLVARPEDHRLLANKGYLLGEFKLHAASAGVFQRLLELRPDHDYAEGLHAYARLHACDWRDFDLHRSRIVDGVRTGRRVCNPLAFLAFSDDAHDARRCAEIFAADRFPAVAPPLWQGEAYRHRKRRIAFLSADFREHPVGYLLIGLVEYFDRRRFETYAISLGLRDGSDLQQRFRNGFDHFLECADKTSTEIARLMRSLEIDIAIDLSGYTAGSRLDILAFRPAPIQMTYLGFPGGLGAPYIDHLIADEITIPPQLQTAYRERVLYLPRCYLPRDTSVRPAAAVPERSACGLPPRGTVFCSFNHAYKINPPIFEAWMDLLRRTPGSVLWLMKLNEDAERMLLEHARRLEVDPARLVFATRVPRIEDHLARYRHADVFLDTFPYNGHTTASDALYAGVPVVTLAGTTFASRVAASLIASSGRAGHVARTLEDYQQAAQALAEDPGAPGLSPGEWHTSPAEEASSFGDLLASLSAQG